MLVGMIVRFDMAMLVRLAATLEFRATMACPDLLDLGALLSLLSLSPIGVGLRYS